MRLLLLLPLITLISCGVRSNTTVLAPTTSSFFTASDGKQLPLQHWNLQTHPRTVVIGLHGIEGAARDYRNLGKTLAKDSPQTTLYALNLRGGGYDPELAKRGDIASSELWLRDLRELQRSLRKRHPQARFVWVGESMGALIVLNSVEGSEDLPDRLVLVSPVVSLDAIPRWQVAGLKMAAFLAPHKRVDLAALAGGSFQATTNSEHFEQSASNEYHVDRYSLRYLRSLAALADRMEEQSEEVNIPTLILYGGEDSLASDAQIEDFAGRFPKLATLREFPESHHLLFYDQDRKEVVKTILNWMVK